MRLQQRLENANSSFAPMPIMDRSSDIRICLLNVTLVLNAPQQPSWQRSAEAHVLDGSAQPVLATNRRARPPQQQALRTTRIAP
jgi:hypothetical protein